VFVYIILCNMHTYVCIYICQLLVVATCVCLVLVVATCVCLTLALVGLELFLDLVFVIEVPCQTGPAECDGNKKGK